MRIKIITTGGTIDKTYFDALSEYQVGDPFVNSLLKWVNASFDYEIISLFRKDSLEITDADRNLIRAVIEASDDYDHFLITHGTDTMVDTAKFLSGFDEKTIVLTGALQPAIFKISDAEFNLGVALGALQSLPAGVYITMNGRVFIPENVRKNRKHQQFEPIKKDK